MPQRTIASGLVVLAACVVFAGVADGAPASGSKTGTAVEDLLFDLQIVPLDGQAPKPFTLQSLAGKRISLADLRGRPALLYFWATW